MSRRVVRLTTDHLDDLPAPGPTCLAWEMDPVRRARLDVDQRREAKLDWVSRVLLEWGSCGQVLLVDGAVEGFIFYAPPFFTPGADALPTAPVSGDAVLLTTAYVSPERRGGGLGRMLVQGMVRDLVRRDLPREGGLRAVEAFGDRRPSSRPVLEGVNAADSRSSGNGSDSGRAGHTCQVPADFLSAVGFTTQRDHPRSPRMRIELRSAVSWKDEVEWALERLLGVVRPATQRAPTALPGGGPPTRG